MTVEVFTPATLLRDLLLVVLAMLPRHHGEGSRRQASAEPALDDVLGGMLLGVREPDELVGGEGGCGEADGKVDTLSKTDVLEGIEAVV